ncbi:fucolectin-7 [Biomphalaria glabrata]|nr:fucolectin-7-like [Biomphalaria glabrata]
MYLLLCVHLNMVVISTGLFNAARLKPAMQSTLYKRFYAYRANDGNTDGSYQHTDLEYVPWWMVDLLGLFDIEVIRLTNRMDPYSRRLRNFEIDIFEQDPRRLANFPNIRGQVCYNQTDPLDGGTYNYTCNGSIVGRYVRLVMRPGAPELLHICEMEVLVSGSIIEEINFQIKVNTKLLDSPFAELTVPSSFLCLRKCLLQRSTDFCTASNWITSTRSCQLFSVNPYLDISHNLTFSMETHFYIQMN